MSSDGVIMGVARARRHKLELPATEEVNEPLRLDILIAPACAHLQADDRRALILYVLDPEPSLFAAACVHIYAGSGYYANAPADSPEARYGRVHIVGVGHSREAFSADANGWDAASLRYLRRRDFPICNHPSVLAGRGPNLHAQRLAAAFSTTIFPFAEAHLGISDGDGVSRALLGASYTSVLALQVLLASPAATDAFILGSPSVPFDPVILDTLRAAPAPQSPSKAPSAFIAYGELERESPPPPPSSDGEPARLTSRLANVHYGIPDAAHELARVLGDGGISCDGPHAIQGEDHTSLKLALVSRGVAWLVNARWVGR